jgi:hypothetical protein
VRALLADSACQTSLQPAGAASPVSAVTAARGGSAADAPVGAVALRGAREVITGCGVVARIGFVARASAGGRTATQVAVSARVQPTAAATDDDGGTAVG